MKLFSKYNFVRIMTFTVIVVITSALLLSMSSCKSKKLTEEEHLERLTEKVNQRFFGENPKTFFHPDVQQYFTATSCDISIIKAGDGGLDFFLIEFEPIEIGYIMGNIIDNEYYYNIQGYPVKNSKSPYTERGIEKGERYAVRSRVPVELVDGQFVDMKSGNAISETNIDKMLKDNRSYKTKRKIKKLCSEIKI